MRIRALAPVCQVIVLIAWLSACAQAAAARSAPGPATAGRTVPIVPIPARVEPREGSFVISAQTALVARGDNGEAARIARDLAARLQQARGFAPALVPDAPDTARAAIVLELDARDVPPGDEAYVLDVSPDGARVRARAPAGLFYGAISLFQLATADSGNGPATLPAVHLEDAPRFAWRGLLLDVARHFRSADEVKALIDQMAQHKLNTLHWHLTDDQGWRIAIRRYPELTRTGACRIPAGAAGRDAASGEPSAYCGFYTQEQVRDIVRYAAERFVTVVPELDLPGHAQAAIASYPGLGVTGARPPVSPDWGIHTWLFNIDEPTFAFLENVLDEMLELFPSRYIHLGGDEAVKDQWQQSAAVQAKRRELGLANEMALQSWFMGRLEKYLAAHGRRMIGWDEILEGGLPPQATVMSWRGPEGAIAAARQGHDAILSPSPDLYFDHVQSDAADEQGGRLDVIALADVYRYEPVPGDLEPALARHVLGAQANVWSEHQRTSERVQRAAFPRAAALAEVLWSPREARDWSDFQHRLAPQMARYRAQAFAASDSAFAVRFAPRRAADGRIALALSNQGGFGELRYTLDGSAPSLASPLYAEPLLLPTGTSVNALAFADGIALGEPRRIVLDDGVTRSRASAELRRCSEGLSLRMEDDAPADGVGGTGARTLFTADIFDPCWTWVGAPLDGAHEIVARVGQLPFNFQLWRDTAQVVSRPANGPEGALEIRLDGCAGEPAVVLPLGPAVHSAGVSELRGKLPAIAGSHDLCLRFATGSANPLWVIDRVSLH